MTDHELWTMRRHQARRRERVTAVLACLIAMAMTAILVLLMGLLWEGGAA